MKIFLHERNREVSSFPQKRHAPRPQVRATSLNHPHPGHIKGRPLRRLEPSCWRVCTPPPLSGPVLFKWTLTVKWAAPRSLQFPGGARGRCGHVDTHGDLSCPGMTLPATICRKGPGERVIRPRPAVHPLGAQSSWGQRYVYLKPERETRSLVQRPALPRPLAHP